MAEANVTVVFEGLLLFCNPELNGKKYCEVGLHSQAEGHEVAISVRQKNGQLIPPHPVFLPENPIYRSHAEIREFTKLFLYTSSSDAAPPTPADNSVTVKSSFHSLVLDIQGPDFYNQPGDVVDTAESCYKPSLFISTGSFSGVKPTADNEFCRVDEEAVDDLFALLESGVGVLDSAAWASVFKHPLKSFARQVEAEISLAQESALVLRARRTQGPDQVLFALPHPSVLGLGGYDITISNLDDNVLTNCPAFIHHSRAFKHAEPTNYGLYWTDPFSASPHKSLLDATAKLMSINFAAQTRETGSQARPAIRWLSRRSFVYWLMAAAVLGITSRPDAESRVPSTMASNITPPGCCLGCTASRTRTLFSLSQDPWRE